MPRSRGRFKSMRRYPALLSLLAVLLGSTFAPAAERIPAPRVEGEGDPAVREKHDLRYHEGNDRRTLDVFAPEGARGRPVIFFVHGGGWIVGDKNLFGLYRGIGRF